MEESFICLSYQPLPPHHHHHHPELISSATTCSTQSARGVGSGLQLGKRGRLMDLGGGSGGAGLK